jgi:hypothetical protein
LIRDHGLVNQFREFTQIEPVVAPFFKTKSALRFFGKGWVRRDRLPAAITNRVAVLNRLWYQRSFEDSASGDFGGNP